MKKFLPIVLVLLFVSLLTTGYFYNQRFQKTTETENEVVEKTGNVLYLFVRLKENEESKNIVEIGVKPNQTLAISAFSLNGTVTVPNTQASLIPTQIDVTPSEIFSGKNWSFALNKLGIKNGKINVELSAYHIGEKGFEINKEIIIGYFEINPYEKVDTISTIFNMDNTKFYASDAVTPVGILFEPDEDE